LRYHFKTYTGIGCNLLTKLKESSRVLRSNRIWRCVDESLFPGVSKKELFQLLGPMRQTALLTLLATHRHRATSQQTCANLEPSIFPELSSYWNTDFVPEDAITPDGMMQWRTQEFFSGGFNKFSWGKRTERTGIWGRLTPSQGFWRQL